MHDLTIIGGGIVGLSVGWAITRRFPKKRILILEKEARWGYHQTGHNSGEIHSGIYYVPGSLKATLCREGNRTMVEFCRDHGIPHLVCGKVIVAVGKEEIGRLRLLSDRARVNAIDVRWLSGEELRELEPHCRGDAALHVPSTGLVDYQHVAMTFAELIEKAGGELRLNTEVTGLSPMTDYLRIESQSASFETRFVINCAGLHSDRIAKLVGLRTGMRIIPIRGEYYGVKEKQHLVRTLIYPLPNPHYPFLGVHFNRLMNGQLRVGPSAVISLQREGYRRNAFNLSDVMELCASAAFWRFAAANWCEGSKELARSLSKALFVRQARRLIPELRAADLTDFHTGVRAQAVGEKDGRAIDDFVIVKGPRSLHVCNAPSPAATASIPIGMTIVDRLQADGIV